MNAWLASHEGGCVSRGLLWSTETYALTSLPRFCQKWRCFHCREYMAPKESQRILRAFDGQAMFVALSPESARAMVARAVRDSGGRYVSVPVAGKDRAFLTTIPAVGEEERFVEVDDPDEFVKEVLMALRFDHGRRGSSRGFLPRVKKGDGFGAYHKGTGRRCWHCHDTEEEARACAVETGMSLDGSADGWYVGPASKSRDLGRFRVTGKRLRELMDQLRIKHSLGWRSLGSRPSEDGLVVEWGPMAWDDERFVELRRLAKWKAPRGASNWQPPTPLLAFRINTETGGVSAAN